MRKEEGREEVSGSEVQRERRCTDAQMERRREK
jgi:hypothetical protein